MSGVKTHQRPTFYLPIKMHSFKSSNREATIICVFTFALIGGMIWVALILEFTM